MTLPLTSTDSFRQTFPKPSCCKRYFPCFNKKPKHRHMPTRMDSISLIDVKAKEILEKKDQK
jgi:hypothetical protein